MDDKRIRSRKAFFADLDLRSSHSRKTVAGKRLLFSVGAALLIFLAGRELAPGFFPFSFGNSAQLSQRLPEFTSKAPHRWLNSPPLSVADLKGEVVFLDVWTFG